MRSEIICNIGSHCMRDVVDHGIILPLLHLLLKLCQPRLQRWAFRARWWRAEEHTAAGTDLMEPQLLPARLFPAPLGKNLSPDPLMWHALAH